MKLLLSCNELGLGHVNRIIPLGKRLEEKGHELFFYSGGTAYQLLQKEFKNVSPCTPVGWYETSYGVIVSASVINILFPLPYFNHDRNKLRVKNSAAMETIHRYYDLRREIRKIKPDLLIADGDMHALRLANRWHIPSVYITNIIRPSYRFSQLLTPGERFTERYVKKATKIIIPDNPPPYTICEHNLGNLDQIGIKDKAKFAGSYTDMTPQKGGHNHIFAPISGPTGTKVKLIKTIVPVLTRLETESIVSLGAPGSVVMKKRGNCEIHSWLPKEQRDRFMRDSKIIIFSGGHGTCFETIKHAKPSICIPTQPEQMGNAKKLQELNCSISVKNQTELKSAIDEIENKAEFYKKNVKKLSDYSRKFNGIESTVNTVENIA
jgi:uncharacterized protein (TIGR00661 family)